MTRHILRLLWNKKRSNFLLFLEIFFAFAILFAVFTIVTRFIRMYVTPLGFETEQVWVAHFNFNNLDYASDTSAVLDMKKRLKAEVEAMPEVEVASFIGFVSPLSGGTWQTTIDQNGFELMTTLHWVDQDYLDAVGLELVQGRWFEEGDDQGRYLPVVITKKLYDKHFRDRNIQDSIYTIQGENKIIGVVRNYKYQGDFSEEKPASFFYQPAAHMEASNLVLRIAVGTTPSFEEKLNETIASITKTNDFTIEHMNTTRSVRARQVWIPIAALLSICAFLVINVAMGLFGVLWYTISKRRGEIGLRRTLGASRGEITQQFMLEILLVSFAAIGLAGVFAVQLPLLGVLDIAPENYYIGMGLSAVLIILLVLLCTLYPSRRAAQIHPAIALHEE